MANFLILGLPSIKNTCKEQGMNFTSDVKKEIISRRIKSAKLKNGDDIAKAALSAFVRTSGIIGGDETAPSFFIVSETENVTEFFTSLFYDVFGFELSVTRATMDRMSRRDKLLLQCPKEKAKQTLEALGLYEDGKFVEGISQKIVENKECRLAYIRGAFLGGGSCLLPANNAKTGYHLEFVFSKKQVAEDFCILLEETDLYAKQVRRKETHVAYIKSKEAISDFFSVIGATNALKKFSSVVERRDEANQTNRKVNCAAGNMDKAMTAAVKQVMAIQKIQERMGLDELGEDLKTLALLRLKNTTMSLQELANQLKISKSCLNHRMRRLMEIAATIEE